jgi:hypothetical protein
MPATPWSPRYKRLPMPWPADRSAGKVISRQQRTGDVCGDCSGVLAPAGTVVKEGGISRDPHGSIWVPSVCVGPAPHDKAVHVIQTRCGTSEGLIPQFVAGWRKLAKPEVGIIRQEHLAIS